MKFERGSPGEDNLLNKILATEEETFGSKLTKSGVDLVLPSILGPFRLKEKIPVQPLINMGSKATLMGLTSAGRPEFSLKII